MSDWGEIRIGIYENYDTKERVEVEVIDYGQMDFRQDGNTLWAVRDKVPAPKKGFVMFADSATDHNVPHLLEIGVKPEQIIITTHPENEAVWRNDE
jgi:hypothetical protein